MGLLNVWYVSSLVLLLRLFTLTKKIKFKKTFRNNRVPMFTATDYTLCRIAENNFLKYAKKEVLGIKYERVFKLNNFDT